MTRLRSWWHNRRWTNCQVCERAFRKGRGGGLSRSVVCSDACYAEAWRRFFEGARS